MRQARGLCFAIVWGLLVGSARADWYSIAAIPLDPTPVAESFGRTIASVGSTLIVGAPGTWYFYEGPENGRAFQFDANPLSPGFGTLLRTYQDPSANDFSTDNADMFGAAVVGIGNRVIISAPGQDIPTPPFIGNYYTDAGVAYVFDTTSGALLRTLQAPALDEFLGFGSFMTNLGANVLISSFNWTHGGSVHMFNPAESGLIRSFDNPFPSEINSHFGSAVVGVGNRVVVGAPDRPSPSYASVFVFDATTGALVRTIQPPVATGHSGFGASIALLGSDLLVTNWSDTTVPGTKGAVYLIDVTTGAVLQTFRKPVYPYPYADEYVGRVAVVGTKVLVGGDSRVFVFEGDRTNPNFGSLLTIVANPEGNSPNNGFGDAMTAIGNGYVAIGDLTADRAGNDRGAVYFYGPCGDGLRHAGEECDDGNLVNDDGCDANCTITRCGNGIIGSGEQCDDGNVANGDGCSAPCAFEPGWTCGGEPTTCTPICGDGLVVGYEPCDEGAANGTPGSCCSVSCYALSGSPCPDDGDVCTNDLCDYQGTCRHDVGRSWACAEPQLSGGASLMITTRPGTSPDQVKFAWGQGPAVPKSDFGGPGSVTDYGLCVYDRMDALVFAGRPSGGVCGTSPC